MDQPAAARTDSNRWFLSKLRRGAGAEIAQMLSADLEEDWLRVREELQRYFGEARHAINPGDRRALYYLARGLSCSRVLEVGTHVGASTTILCLALADEHVQSSASPHLVTVDILDVNDPDNGPWRQLNLGHSPAQVLRELHCEHLVQFVAQPSLTYLQQSQQRFDLIFLDGDHEAEIVYQEIAAAQNLLTPRGVILLHDFFPQGQPLWNNGTVISGPWEAVQRAKALGAPLEAHPLGQLPWPTKEDSNVTSLALLFRTA